jgi:hypothetical protein
VLVTGTMTDNISIDMLVGGYFSCRPGYKRNVMWPEANRVARRHFTEPILSKFSASHTIILSDFIFLNFIKQLMNFLWLWPECDFGMILMYCVGRRALLMQFSPRGGDCI